MNPSPKHPDDRAWLDWILQVADPSTRDRMAAHLAECAVCSVIVDALRVFHAAADERPWQEPPIDTLDAATALPAVDVLPEPEDPAEIEFAAADVRGSGASISGDAHIVARSTGSAEISVLAIPPDQDPTWSIEGRVWLRRPSQGTIRVVLAHTAHVFRQEFVEDGKRFRWQEPLPAGWWLEFHLPDGGCVILRDPTE